MLQSNASSLLVISSMSEVKVDKRGEELGQKYYTLGVRKAKVLQSGKIVADPFSTEIKRNFKQEWKWNEGQIVEGSQHWKFANPEVVKEMIGETIEGEIFTETVVPYMIGEKEVSSFTTFTIKSTRESKESLFKSLGHPIIGSETLKAFQAVGEEINLAAPKIESIASKAKEVIKSPFV